MLVLSPFHITCYGAVHIVHLEIVPNEKLKQSTKIQIRFAELPWDKPATDSNPYVKWKSNDRWTTIMPWRKVDTLALSLLRKILDPNPTKRVTLEAVVEHKWCNMIFENSGESPNIFLLFSFSASDSECDNVIVPVYDESVLRKINIIMTCSDRQVTC